MEKTCLAAAVIAIFAFNLVIGDRTTVFEVAKRLENGDALPDELRSKFTVVCPNYGHLHVVVNTQLTDSHITVYIANRDKNILALTLSGTVLVGHKYETPYGKKTKLSGPFVSRKSEGEIAVNVPRNWIPANATRISASVEVQGDIYNYYGIFNKPISINDTMVVEEFKRVVLC